MCWDDMICQIDSLSIDDRRDLPILSLRICRSSEFHGLFSFSEHSYALNDCKVSVRVFMSYHVVANIPNTPLVWQMPLRCRQGWSTKCC